MCTTDKVQFTRSILLREAAVSRTKNHACALLEKNIGFLAPQIDEDRTASSG